MPSDDPPNDTGHHCFRRFRMLAANGSPALASGFTEFGNGSARAGRPYGNTGPCEFWSKTFHQTVDGMFRGCISGRIGEPDLAQNRRNLNNLA